MFILLGSPASQTKKPNITRSSAKRRAPHSLSNDGTQGGSKGTHGVGKGRRVPEKVPECLRRAPEFKALQDGKAYFVDLLKQEICSPRPARHARRSPAQFFVPA